MKEVRENKAIFGVLMFALACCVAIAFVADSALSRVTPTYECAHSHYTKYEDGSGILKCEGRIVVRVHVPW